MENRHTKEDLAIMQALPLDLKVRLTEDRIRAWVDKYGEDGVCVSFSGGKDSTVLLDIVRNLYPDVRAVFSNTGLEYPEIRQFAMSHDKVDIVYPDVRFKDVITQYGYPLIGKEVAEAIYYARRIGGGAHTSETPRLLSQPTSVENSHFIKTSCSPNRRTVLQGKYPPPMGGGMGQLPQKMSCSKPKRSKGQGVFLEQQRRRCDLHGKWQTTGTTTERAREDDTNSKASKPG